MSWGDGESLDDLLREFVEDAMYMAVSDPDDASPIWLGVLATVTKSLAEALNSPAIVVQIPAVRELVEAAVRLQTAVLQSEDHRSAVDVCDRWTDALEANNE